MALYCIVHKDDAKWMIGEKLDGCSNHAIRHKLYNLDNVREAMKQTNSACLKIEEGGVFEAFNPFIPA